MGEKPERRKAVKDKILATCGHGPWRVVVTVLGGNLVISWQNTQTGKVGTVKPGPAGYPYPKPSEAATAPFAN